MQYHIHISYCPPIQPYNNVLSIDVVLIHCTKMSPGPKRLQQYKIYKILLNDNSGNTQTLRVGFKIELAFD